MLICLLVALKSINVFGDYYVVDANNNGYGKPLVVQNIGDKVVVFCHNGRIYVSNNRGEKWVEHNFNRNIGYRNAVVREQTILGYSSYNKCVVYSQGGDTWEVYDMETDIHIIGKTNNGFLMILNNGKVLTSDSGKKGSWKQMGVYTIEGEIRDIAFIESTNTWVFIENYKVYSTKDFRTKAALQVMPKGLEDYYILSIASANNKLYLLNYDYGILETDSSFSPAKKVEIPYENELWNSKYFDIILDNAVPISITNTGFLVNGDKKVLAKTQESFQLILSFAVTSQDLFLIDQENKLHRYDLKMNKWIDVSVVPERTNDAVRTPKLKPGENWRYFIYPGYDSSITPSLTFSEGLAVMSLDGDRKGFIDESGNIVIPPRYTAANNFSEGLAAVSLHGSYGYIDKTGKMVIPNQYFSMYSFREGLAQVRIGNKFGYINKKGDLVIDAIYEEASPFSEGVAAVRLEGENLYIDKEGKIVLDMGDRNGYMFHDGFALFMKNGKAGVINKSGKEIIPAIYDTINVQSLSRVFFDKFAWVQKDGKWGLIDKNGKVIYPTKMDSVSYFTEGIMRILVDGKIGFMDSTGKVIIQPKYTYNGDLEWIANFGEGLVPIKVNKKFGFIDKTGKTVIPFEYDYAHYFVEGLCLVKKGNKYGYIDKTGKVVIRIQYTQASGFNEGLAIVQLNGKEGAIDKKGNTVIPFQYDSIRRFQEGYAKIMVGKKHGIINKKNQMIVAPQFDKIYDAENYGSKRNGYLTVLKDGLWGYIKLGHVENKK